MKRRIGLLCAALALACALVACTADAPAVTPTPSPAATNTPAASTTPVVISPAVTDNGVARGMMDDMGDMARDAARGMENAAGKLSGAMR